MEVAEIGGVDHFRLMRPMTTETSCLKCHTAQGYKIGDLRGIIPISSSCRNIRADEG